VKKRTRSRELALQFLYQVDLLGPEKLQDLTAFLQEQGEGGDAETTRYARVLVEGTVDAAPELDAEIQAVAQNWLIERMAVIDRNVLRMAAFELLHCDEIPPKVAINEGIELGKRFSTQNSGAFINGILDKIKNRAAAAEGR
jgi:N utilization substance protein B